MRLVGIAIQDLVVYYAWGTVSGSGFRIRVLRHKSLGFGTSLTKLGHAEDYDPATVDCSVHLDTRLTEATQ